MHAVCTTVLFVVLGIFFHTVSSVSEQIRGGCGSSFLLMDGVAE